MTAIFWGTNGSGDWASASLWQGGVVPVMGDDVTIDAPGAYTVTISVPEAADLINLNAPGATLMVSSTLTLKYDLILSLGRLVLNGGAQGGVSHYGKISGGRIVGTNVIFNAGTLDDVIFLGELDLTTAGAALVVSNGLKATGRNGTGLGTIVIGAPGGITNTLEFYDSQTIDNAIISLNYFSNINQERHDAAGDGTLTLGANLVVSQTNGNASFTTTVAGGTLVNQGHIEARGNALMSFAITNFVNQGQIDISQGGRAAIGASGFFFLPVEAFSNTGTIKVSSNASLSINAPMDHLGAISVESGSTLALDHDLTTAKLTALDIKSGAIVTISADLDNTAGVLSVGPGLTLSSIGLSGTITGGTIIDSGAGMTFNNATLDGVTYNGMLLLPQGTLTVTGAGLVAELPTPGPFPGFPGPPGPGSIVVGGVGFFDATLRFLDTQTVDNATINLGGGGGSNNTIDQVTSDSYYAAHGHNAGTLTLGPNLILDHSFGADALASDGPGRGTIINQGTIVARAPGGLLTLRLGTLPSPGAGSFDNQGLIAISGNDTVAVAGGILTNTGTISLADTAVMTLNTALGNTGTIEGQGTIAGSIINTSLIAASGGVLDITGDVTGIGTATIAAGATLELGGAVSQSIAFADVSGTLKLDQPQSVAGAISCFLVGDVIDLANTGVTQITPTNVTTTDTTLRVTLSGGVTISLDLLGDYTGEHFSAGTDSSGFGTAITTSAAPTVDVTTNLTRANLLATQRPLGATILLTGTVDNGNGTLYVGPGTSLPRLVLDYASATDSYGRISGGTVVDYGSGGVFNLGFLDGVTYDGTLDLSTPNAFLFVTGAGLISHALNGTDAGTILLGRASDPILSNIQHRIDFVSSQAIDNTTIELTGFRDFIQTGGDPTSILTFGTGLTVHQGDGEAVLFLTGNSTIVSNGRIDLSAAGGSFQIGPGHFFNQGKIDVSNGDRLFLAGGTVINSGTVGLTDASLLSLNTSIVTGTLDNTGIIEGNGTIAGGLINESLILAQGGVLDITGPITGAGAASIAAGATLELGGASAQSVTFAGGAATLRLDDPAGFTGAISGFAAGDAIDFTNTDITHVSQIGGTLHGTLTGGTTLALNLLGDLTGVRFTTHTDTAGTGTDVLIDTAAPPGITPVTGLLDNTGGTLIVGPSTVLGTIELSGTIRGGTIVDLGSGIDSHDGTLDGVTYDGMLDLSRASASIAITGAGLIAHGVDGTGDGTIQVGSSATYSGTISFQDSQTIDHATIALHYFGSYLYQVDRQHQDGTLTLGPSLRIEQSDGGVFVTDAFGFHHSAIINQGTIHAAAAGGYMIIDPVTFINQGKIDVTNGELLRLAAGTFTNSGTIVVTGDSKLVVKDPLTQAGNISVESGSTITLGGVFTLAELQALHIAPGAIVDITGTLDNTDGILLVGPDTTLAHVGLFGRITGGTIVDPNASISFHAGTLSGVTYEGTLDLSPRNAALTVDDGGLAMRGANGTGSGTILLGTGGNPGGSITFQDDQTIDNATIYLDAQTAAITETTTNAYTVSHSGRSATLTLGANLTIDQEGDSLSFQGSGHGTLAAFGSGGIVNDGSIHAASAGGTLTIGPSDFTNNGEIVVSNGDTVQFAGTGFLSTGLISVSGTSSVATGGTLDNEGTLAIAGAGGGVFDAITLGAQLGQNGTITLTGTASTLTVQHLLWVDAGGGGGSLRIGAGARVTAGSVLVGFRGLVTIESGGTLDPPTSITSDGTIMGSGVIEGALINNGLLLAQGGRLDITGDVTGVGSASIAAGATLGFGGVDTETVTFAGPGGTLRLDHPLDFTGKIAGFVAGDGIDFAGAGLARVTPTTIGATDTTLQVALTDGTELNLDLLGTFAADSFSLSPDGTGIVTNALPDGPVCFAAGTQIRTMSGEVPVERLAIGDMVRTLGGAGRRIVWIGMGRVLASRGQRTAATPVIVRKGAVADNVPHRDLRITKAHSLYVDGVLIPVEFLVNHRSIIWDDHAQGVVIYHIELETHDILLANGVPAESYRDDGNRWLFQNANTGWNLPSQAPYAPVLTGGPIVDAVWRRLLDRSGSRPTLMLTKDPDLHLLVDGKRVNPMSVVAGAHLFRLPGRPAIAWIASRTGSPAELGLARDPRMLGVAVRRISLRQGARSRALEAADQALTEGFHTFEPDNGCRWTNGDAVLPTSLFEDFDGPLDLTLSVGGMNRYPLLGDPIRAAA